MWGDHDDELAFELVVGELGEDFADGADEEGFEALGDFACDADGAVWAIGFVHVVDALHDAVAGFVADEGVVGVTVMGEELFAAVGLLWHEAGEEKAVGGEAGGDQGVEEGGWAGDGVDVEAAAAAFAYDAEAGVVKPRGAGVADDGNGFAGCNTVG